MKKIFIASDHAGFTLKKFLMEKRPQLPWKDLGPQNESRVDYPDFADKLCLELKNYKDNDECLGVLVCGSGQGMAIRANRYPFIRAALCWNSTIANLARGHNNANVLCLGSRALEPEFCLEILDSFLETPFDGDRHTERVKKLGKI